MNGETQARPLPFSLYVRLSVMMLFQFAVWGAWFPIFKRFMVDFRGFEPYQASVIIGVQAAGPILAPFIGGQIADRWMRAERFIALCHLLSAALVLLFAYVTSYPLLILISIAFSLAYFPTLPLSAAITFRHVPDRRRDFGPIRIWGTVGWFAVGIAVGQWLLRSYEPSRRAEGMGDAFLFSAVIAAVLGLYCLTLPKSPPTPGRRKFAPLQALEEVSRTRVLFLFALAVLYSAVGMHFFFHCASFLEAQKIEAGALEQIFGGGGIGLMTVNQLGEILFIAILPFSLRHVPQKTLLAIGLALGVLRFVFFAYWPTTGTILLSLLLHGPSFVFFILITQVIVDQTASSEVKNSAQSLFTQISLGLGLILGNVLSGIVGQFAVSAEGEDFTLIFAVPTWISAVCFVAFLIFYPKREASYNPES